MGKNHASQYANFGSLLYFRLQYSQTYIIYILIIDERQKVQLQFPKYHPDVLPYVANGMKSL